MRRIVIYRAGAALLAACTDRLPADVAGPATQDVTGTEASLVEHKVDARAGIDDALERVIPALTDRAAARPPEGALNGVRNALSGADQAAIPDLIAAANRAVDRHARTGQDATDLDVVRLGIDFAEDALRAGR